ncbi:protein CutA homolog [Drosophila serrata]|uniref:protein CutA homolog n=1 Tax=Drosophila serrata TaxID=7274 RepID=UPI000A1D1235|nr:protein CutA homolog [Drosophila serrata]
MQNLGCVKFLPYRWLFASNLCIAIAFASTSSVTRSLPSNTSSRLCRSNQHIFDIQRSASKMSDKTSGAGGAAAAESYQAGSNSVVFITTPDRESAKKLAHSIIERRLAACVNIVPQIESIYLWEGKVNEDNEYLMMIKTRTERVDELSKFVRENHPYSVAEVISLPIQNGNLPYLKWITETVPGLGSKD